jgi:predicted  nucleic acid-binding Zn-ribbon protein
MSEKKDAMMNIIALQNEIKSEQLKNEQAYDEIRKVKVKQMEKSAEYTDKMNEFLNIREEKEKALKEAEHAEKKLKETKRVRITLILEYETKDQVTYPRLHGSDI